MEKENLKKYFKEARESTSTGEHLFILNTLLFEIVKNTTPDIINKEDKEFNHPNT